MPSFLNIDGPYFRDEHNRQVTLRGVNVASDAKMPTKPNLLSHVLEDFFDGDNVSFIGRPFTLEDADIHFQRLRNCGYNVIRYIYTWEAIEARGPYVFYARAKGSMEGLIGAVVSTMTNGSRVRLLY